MLNSTNVQFTIKAQFNSFVGIGFGNGMQNTDMNILQITSASQYNLTDSYSTGHSAPKTDFSLGGTNDLQNITYQDGGNGYGVVSYSRLLNTGDKYDKILSGGSNPLIVAWGNGLLNYHKSNYIFSAFQLIIPSNDTNTTDDNSTSDNSTTPDTGYQFSFFDLHGYSLIILWTVFNFLGYISARFLKHHKWWIWAHFASSGLTGYYSISILIPSIYYAFPNDAGIYFHMYFGICLFGFIVLQVIFGNINFFGVYFQTSVKSDSIHKTKNVHRVK